MILNIFTKVTQLTRCHTSTTKTDGLTWYRKCGKPYLLFDAESGKALRGASYTICTRAAKINKLSLV